MTRDGWTITEASEDFARTGQPLPARQLAMIIRALPGFQRTGKKPSGPLGGQGEALYEIGDLQLLHGFLAKNGWLRPPGGNDG